MFHIFLILSFILFRTLAHKCISGQSNLTLSYLPSTAHHHNSSSNDRILQEAYESIRIHTDFTYVPSDNPQIKDYIQNQLVPSAVSYFEQTLKVIRLQYPVEASPSCQGLVTPPNLIDPGVEADLVILVGGEYYDNDFVAFAVPCGLSLEDNRPAFGALIFNLNYLPMDTVTDDQENLSTTLHEIIHILGFGDSLYPYYIDPTTYTPLTNHIGTTIVNGVETNYINVEPLTSRLRAYFGCDTLEGAYLENEGEVGSAGSHFERRVFMNEFMTASSVTDPVISEFTLALLEGTGWYQVNYNMTEPFNWGRGEGCPFLNDACVDGSAQPNFNDFCSPLGNQGCTYTARARAVCGNEEGVPNLQTIAYPQFNYWGDGTSVLDVFADNCPYYVGSNYTDCENPLVKPYALLEEEVYGPNSRCFTGTLVPPLYQSIFASYCFETSCQQQDNGNYVVIITIGTNSVTCVQEGPVSLDGLEGQLNCPEPNAFCTTSNPQYCEKGCSGRGECVDNICQCPEGWEGSDCAERRFADNCAKCANLPGMTGCYGDVCGCDSSTQTCPLIDFKKAGPLISSNESQSPEALRKALKDMMEPFLSRVSGKN